MQNTTYPTQDNEDLVKLTKEVGFGNAALNGDQTITLVVSGGGPTEHLERITRVTGMGEAYARVKDDLGIEENFEQHTLMSSDQVRALFRSVYESEVLTKPQAKLELVPHALVATLTIKDGSTTAVRRFPGEEETRTKLRIMNLPAEMALLSAFDGILNQIKATIQK